MAANTPVAFGAVLAGGLLLEHGLSTAKGAFAGSPAGAATTGLPGATAGGGKSPFPGGWIPNRLDAGYDGTFKGQITAPFNGIITFAATGFSNWGGYLELKADGGNIPGLQTDTLYFAEGLTPLVQAGQRVTAGTPIANPGSSPYGSPYGTGGSGNIEWGPAISGTVGSPTDPLVHAVSDPQGMVLAFAKWAETVLGLPPPSETGSAGHG